MQLELKEQVLLGVKHHFAFDVLDVLAEEQ